MVADNCSPWSLFLSPLRAADILRCIGVTVPPLRLGPPLTRIVYKAPTAQAPQCSTQRAGITPPRTEGDGLSGVTSDRESFAFISAPACCVGGVPLTRAKNPWAMPEAST